VVSIGSPPVEWFSPLIVKAREVRLIASVVLFIVVGRKEVKLIAA
jgi:hypothetical protein